jgi:predicted RNA-binding protein with PUA-like domain
MAYFLAKADPDTYPFSRLESEKETLWDGVTNPVAVKAIQAMKKGDSVLIYHSGAERAIVGLARVASAPRPDPANAKAWVVDFRCGPRLDPPTTLAEVKAAGRFADFALVRMGRLSTMSAPEDFIAWLRTRYPKIKL